jgi:proteasome lid subunit RPN8/RPN11
MSANPPAPLTTPAPPADGAGLAFPAEAYAQMVAAAYAAYPLEACGLLVGRDRDVHRFVPCTNEAASAKVYAIPGRELLRAERAAEDDGLAIIGVFHSHTHSEPYPSPTDLAQAADPTWHYVIVSLKRESPEARCYLLPDPHAPDSHAPAPAAGDVRSTATGIREVPITVT